MLKRSLYMLSFTTLSAALVFACGGAIGNSTTTAGDGGTTDGGGVDGSIVGSLEGSYDLTFGSVVLAMPQQIGNQASPPSLSKAVRVDIRKQADGTYQAVFTSRWGRSSALACDVSASAVALTGSGEVRSDDGYFVTDTYKSLVFARGADGTLTGGVTASGQEDLSEGDYIITSPITATGAIARDATAPELRASLTSDEGPENALLPWDVMHLDVAEPVAFDAVPTAFRLSASGGASIPITWRAVDDTENPSAIAWAGATQGNATIATWGDALAPTLSLSATSTIADRVGHTNAAFAATPVFLALPQHQTTHDFDSDVLTVGSWGSPLFLGGLAGSDPNCENGGCVEIGPFDNGVCGAPRVGIAGLIDGASATRVHVRYRVLLDDMGGGQAPQSYGAAFVVDAARPGVDMKSTPSTTMPTDFKHLATPVLGMVWATDWATLDAPLPSGTSTTIGFTVRAGAYASAGCGGPVPAPVKTIVLVDSVTAE